MIKNFLTKKSWTNKYNLVVWRIVAKIGTDLKMQWISSEELQCDNP